MISRSSSEDEFPDEAFQGLTINLPLALSLSLYLLSIYPGPRAQWALLRYFEREERKRMRAASAKEEKECSARSAGKPRAFRIHFVLPLSLSLSFSLAGHGFRWSAPTSLLSLSLCAPPRCDYSPVRGPYILAMSLGVLSLSRSLSLRGGGSVPPGTCLDSQANLALTKLARERPSDPSSVRHTGIYTHTFNET